MYIYTRVYLYTYKFICIYKNSIALVTSFFANSVHNYIYV